MGRIHRVLVFLVAVVIEILVVEVDNYPTFFPEPACPPRSLLRRYGRPPYRGCPPCYACRDDRSCQFVGCKSSHDKIVENMGICVINSRDRREVRCARLKGIGNETSLRVEKSWKLPLKNDSSVSGVGIVVDKAKNAFIGLIDSRKIRLLVYNADTELVADVYLGSVEEKYSNSEMDGIRSGDVFCLVEVVPPKPNTQDNPHIVKCIRMSKYVNATWYHRRNKC